MHAYALPPLASSASSLSVAAQAHATVLRDRCERGKLELPVLPEVAHNVRMATDKPDVDPRVLADLVRRDAAFAAHVLRIANSPAYAARSPIGSLQQAMTRLGLRAIGEIALVISCKTRAFSVKGHEAEVRALFQHSLAAGLHAREIARLRRRNIDDAFLGGLLHDVGCPTLIQALVDQGDDPALPRLGPDDIGAIVRELHEEVGASIIMAWGLPPRLAESVRHHHHPELALDPEAAAVMALADELAHLGVPVQRIEEDAIRTHPAAAALNLYPEDVDALIAKTSDIISQAESLL